MDVIEYVIVAKIKKADGTDGGSIAVPRWSESGTKLSDAVLLSGTPAENMAYINGLLP